MSWMDLLGALTGALGQPQSGSSISQVGRVGQLPPEYSPAPSSSEVAAAEAETKRMLMEAQREMLEDFAQNQLVAYSERVGRTEDKIIDIESNVMPRIDEIKRTLDAVETSTLSLEKLEKKVNVLLVLAGLAVAASVAILVRSFL